jgi:hypothetical protein
MKLSKKIAGPVYRGDADPWKTQAVCSAAGAKGALKTFKQDHFLRISDATGTC